MSPPEVAREALEVEDDGVQFAPDSLASDRAGSRDQGDRGDQGARHFSTVSQAVSRPGRPVNGLVCLRFLYRAIVVSAACHRLGVDYS